VEWAEWAEWIIKIHIHSFLWEKGRIVPAFFYFCMNLHSMNKVIPLLKNKYLLVGVFFVVWMIFFDTNSFISISKHRKELREVKKEKDYYTSEIIKNKELIDLYKTDKKALEKLAREKYLMKKDNEDVYLIVYEE
jgi:cell division protein FtsB